MTQAPSPWSQPLPFDINEALQAEVERQAREGPAQTRIQPYQGPIEESQEFMEWSQQAEEGLSAMASGAPGLPTVNQVQAAEEKSGGGGLFGKLKDIGSAALDKAGDFLELPPVAKTLEVANSIIQPIEETAISVGEAILVPPVGPWEERKRAAEDRLLQAGKTTATEGIFEAGRELQRENDERPLWEQIVLGTVATLPLPILGIGTGALKVPFIAASNAARAAKIAEYAGVVDELGVLGRGAELAEDVMTPARRVYEGEVIDVARQAADENLGILSRQTIIEGEYRVMDDLARESQSLVPSPRSGLPVATQEAKRLMSEAGVSDDVIKGMSDEDIGELLHDYFNFRPGPGAQNPSEKTLGALLDAPANEDEWTTVWRRWQGEKQLEGEDLLVKARQLEKEAADLGIKLSSKATDQMRLLMYAAHSDIPLTHLPAAWARWVEKVRQLIDDETQAILEVDPEFVNRLLPDYFPQFFKQVPVRGEPRAGSRAPLGARFGFERGRVTEGTLEDILAGRPDLDLKTWNPLEMALLRVDQGINHRANLREVQRLMAKGLVYPKSSAPVDWVEMPGHPAFKDMAMPKEVADALKDQFGVSAFSTNQAGKIVRTGVATLKMVKTFGGLFQHIDYTMRLLGLGGGLFKPQAVPAALKAIARGFVPGLHERLLVSDLKNPVRRALLENGLQVQGGLDILENQLRVSLRPGGMFGDLPVPFVKDILNYFSSATYTNAHREFLMSAGEMLVKKGLSEGKPLQKAAADAVLAVNEQFSSLPAWQSFLRSPTTRDALRTLVLFSPNETEAWFRSAFRLVPGSSKVLGAGPGPVQAFRYWAGMYISVAGYATMANLLFTGKMPDAEMYQPFVMEDGKPKFNTRFMRPELPFLTPEGRKAYLDILGQADTPFRWIGDPKFALRTRLGQFPQLAGAGYQYLTGQEVRGFFGEPVTGPKSALKWAMSQVSPIPVTGFLEERSLIGPEGSWIQAGGFNVSAERTGAMRDRITQELGLKKADGTPAGSYGDLSRTDRLKVEAQMQPAIEGARRRGFEQGQPWAEAQQFTVNAQKVVASLGQQLVRGEITAEDYRDQRSTALQVAAAQRAVVAQQGDLKPRTEEDRLVSGYYDALEKARTEKAKSMGLSASPQDASLVKLTADEFDKADSAYRLKIGADKEKTLDGALVVSRDPVDASYRQWSKERSAAYDEIERQFPGLYPGGQAYNAENPAHRDFVRSNPQLAALREQTQKPWTPAGAQAPVTFGGGTYEDKVRKLEVDQGLVDLAKKALAGDVQAMAEWGRNRGDFQQIKFGLGLGLEDIKPETAIGKMVQEYYDIQLKDFTDEAGNEDWDAFEAAREAKLATMPTDVAEAIRNPNWIDPDIVKFDAIYRQARDLLDTAPSKYKGLDGEFADQYALFARDVNFYRPIIEQQLGRAVRPDDIARRLATERGNMNLYEWYDALQSPTERDKLRNPAYDKFLADNQAVLQPVYRSLYGHTQLNRMGLLAAPERYQAQGINYTPTGIGRTSPEELGRLLPGGVSGFIERARAGAVAPSAAPTGALPETRAQVGPPTIPTGTPAPQIGPNARVHYTPETRNMTVYDPDTKTWHVFNFGRPTGNMNTLNGEQALALAKANGIDETLAPTDPLVEGNVTPAGAPPPELSGDLQVQYDPKERTLFVMDRGTGKRYYYNFEYPQNTSNTLAPQQALDLWQRYVPSTGQEGTTPAQPRVFEGIEEPVITGREQVEYDPDRQVLTATDPRTGRQFYYDFRYPFSNRNTLRPEQAAQLRDQYMREYYPQDLGIFSRSVA